jgi:hypothetical protein
MNGRRRRSIAPRAASAVFARPEKRNGRRRPAEAPARQEQPVEQLPSAWPNAPEDLKGIARTLSRGLP